jgi:hypothetical protein
MAKSYLSKADFLAGILQRPVDLDVPGLGVVRVQGLTAEQLSDLQLSFESKPPIEVTIQMAYRGLVEPQLSEEDIAALHQANFGYINAIANRVMALSGVGGTTANSEELENLAGGG